jgi:hypothetical protein
MPVTKMRSRWVAGNLQFVRDTDASAICHGIVAVSGATTKAAATLAVPITHRFVTMTTGGVEALTLANGAPGQEITITLGTDGGDGTLTPATCTGFATIVFADAKDTVHLRYLDDTLGWIIMGYYGTAAPPVVS